MAQAQYGSIITELKGKHQGTVFQKGSNGTIMRSKGYRAGYSSPARQGVTTRLVTITTLWRTLTPDQVASWAGLVGVWILYDKFGNVVAGNPYRIFVAVNARLLTMGLDPVLSAPSLTSPTNPGTFIASYVPSTSITIYWDNAGTSTDYVVIYASAVGSAGRNLNNPRLSLIKMETVDSDTEVSFTIPYKKVFGIIPPSGQIIVRASFRNASYPYDYYTQTVACLPSS